MMNKSEIEIANETPRTRLSLECSTNHLHDLLLELVDILAMPGEPIDWSKTEAERDRHEQRREERTSGLIAALGHVRAVQIEIDSMSMRLPEEHVQ